MGGRFSALLIAPGLSINQHTSLNSCMASSTTAGSTSARMRSIVASDLSVSGSRRISSCLRLQKMASEMFPCSIQVTRRRREAVTRLFMPSTARGAGAMVAVDKCMVLPLYSS